MICMIDPRPLEGTVRGVPSKSSLHRQLIFAALSDKVTAVDTGRDDVPASDDVFATVDCLCALGAEIEYAEGVFSVTPISEPPSKAELRCVESGSTLRFLLPVAAALGVDSDFIMEGRLPDRPLGPITDLLRMNGCSVSRREKNVISVRGKLTGNRFSVRADVSSQFISGLIFALPILGGGKIDLSGREESAGYTEMTIAEGERFGLEIVREDHSISVDGKIISPGKVHCEGDWSSAAFWLAAGALGGNGITCTGLDLSSRQRDRYIVDILHDLGAEVEITDDSVTVRPGVLRRTDVDAADVPDLVPAVASVAALAEGETVISGASRLRLKESDRLAAVSDALNSLGASVAVTGDGLRIRGASGLRGGKVDGKADHRIVMASAIASAACDKTVNITDAEAVSKSYPSFWDDFRQLGGKFEMITESEAT